MGSRSTPLFACLIVAALAEASLAFLPYHQQPLSLPRTARRRAPSTTTATPPSSAAHFAVLRAASNGNNPVEITFPTPDDAASMGIRDWPQQFHPSAWTDEVPEGSIATRYVLEGRGRVTIDYTDDVSGEARRAANRRVYPGTLVEVDGEATLSWEVDDDDDREGKGMIVLTPGYEEGGKLILVGGFFLVFCAGLLIGSGGF